MAKRTYLGIDVGTGSVRAGLFDPDGRTLGVGVHPIAIFRPTEDHVEQSSDDIWAAACEATRAALADAGVDPHAVAGIGFDATCSLVALDDRDKPVSISTSGVSAQNVIVWMDHRAIEQARRVNATKHDVLRYVGGVISPEMQTPKLLWLKENLPDCWRRSARFLDLPDYLVYRATGLDVRSLCTTTCKWTYLAHKATAGGPDGFQSDFFRAVGLSDLADEGYRRVGNSVRPMGEPVGGLRAQAATELGLTEGIPVGVAIIDAHAGGLGMLGATLEGATDESALEHRLCLIGGTSSCHMAVGREARYPAGIWGPYYSAMVPGMWLTEGGQSATGALIEHVIDTHACGAALRAEAKRDHTTVFALLNSRLDQLANQSAVSFPAELTRELHVLPYFHGNRSPRADPTLRGMISGLRLTDSVDSLALLYLATIQAIAHGTRHIIDTMNGSGFRIDTLMACGGDTRNPVFLREHADATGCRVVLPRESEAVLLGAAVLGAVASGDQPSVLSAMAKMNAAGADVAPTGAAVADYHACKHRVFHRMYDDQLAYRTAMAST